MQTEIQLLIYMYTLQVMVTLSKLCRKHHHNSSSEMQCTLYRMKKTRSTYLSRKLCSSDNTFSKNSPKPMYQ